MKLPFELGQVAYAQKSIAESMSKGYSAIAAVNMHIDSLLLVSAIKSFDQAKSITLRAAELNGIKL